MTQVVLYNDNITTELECKYTLLSQVEEDWPNRCETDNWILQYIHYHSILHVSYRMTIDDRQKWILKAGKTTISRKFTEILFKKKCDVEKKRKNSMSNN